MRKLIFVLVLLTFAAAIALNAGTPPKINLLPDSQIEVEIDLLNKVVYLGEVGFPYVDLKEKHNFLSIETCCGKTITIDGRVGTIEFFNQEKEPTMVDFLVQGKSR